MKLVSLFDGFLSDTVNLNQTRFTQLEDSIQALKKFVRESAWEPTIKEFAAQGSWAHKTIIKPLVDCPFDADLLVYIEPVKGWEAKDYIDTLYTQFKQSSIYCEKVRRFSHCITIEYANERKIDIAPCIKERNYYGVYEVCNRNENTFEQSSPKDYTDWIVERNRISSRNNLRKVTRLLKYLRDIKTTFTCPSFLLTTLLGKQIFDSDVGSDNFPDTPTALKVLIGRLDDWLQANVTKPDVCNPVLSSEVQSNAWDDTRYRNFREKVNQYRSWIDDAFYEVDREESIGKWRRVFGNDFAKSEVKEKAARISAIALESMVAVGRSIGDLVDGVKTFGRNALPRGFQTLPHMERPTWRDAPGGRLTVQIHAQLYSNKMGSSIRLVDSLAALNSQYWIRFHARGSMGVNFPETYKVMWRVTNTDAAAERANSLRGDFYTSDEHAIRWEQLAYRGVHMVEAFLVRRSDDRLLGVSEPFYVVVE